MIIQWHPCTLHLHPIILRQSSRDLCPPNTVKPNLTLVPFPHIAIGPPNCTMSLTASRVTANSLVISWTIHSYTCLAALPTDYKLTWYPVGELASTDEDTTMTANISSLSINQYEITRLKPSTRYFIALYLNNVCGNGNGYSTHAETASGGFNYNFKNNYVILQSRSSLYYSVMSCS